MADRIEAGTAEPPARPARLALVDILGPEGEPVDDLVDEDEPEGVETVTPLVAVGDQVLSSGEDKMSPAMQEWLASFDDRFRRSPAFVALVNEAAQEFRPLSMATTELIAGKITAIREMAQRAGMSEDGYVKELWG